MQRKKLATKIASILLSATMLVSTTMTAFATDGEVSVAAEQTEVQTVAETAEDAALEASEEDVAAGEEIAEGETAAEEETVADEDITEEIVSEEAQENVEEAQILDAEEVTAEENEIAVAEDNISTVSEPKEEDWKDVNAYIQYAYTDSRTILYFRLTDAGKTAGDADKSLPYVYDAKQSTWFPDASTDMKSTVQKVVVGEGITGIGNNNFNNAGGNYPKLKEVTLSSTVTTIGEGAFQQSTVATINLENVTNIGQSAFKQSSLTAAAFNKDVTIGYEAFYQCPSLTEVYAAGNVTLNTHCFDRCTNLQKFTCNGTVKEIPEAAFYGCSKLNTVTAKGVETVGQSAFYGCDALASFDFSKVTNIADWAFKNSGIKDVTLAATTINIGKEVFCGCTSLEKVTVRGKLSWNEGCFSGCTSLTSFVCDGSSNVIPTDAFDGCSKLATCTVKGTDGKGVKEVYDYAFYECESLTSFDFSNATLVGSFAIYDSGITNLVFNNENLTLRENAFYNAEKLTKICYAGTMEKWNAIVEAQGAAVPETTTIHSQADTTPVAATCTEDGWKELGVCDSCGKAYTDKTKEENRIPARGHAYSTSYTVDKKATCIEEGSESHHCTRCNAIEPGSERVIPKTGHTWSWTTQSKATVFKAEVQKGVCTLCKATETRTVGKKLTPTITVNARKIWLQKGQKTSAFKVSGLANGDSIKSYKSSNTKIFTVTNKGVIKAGKKVGTAKLTVTLASGTKKVIPIVVQKRQVKTWHIYNLPAKVTIKKGATYKLSPVISLITSTHKVTYKTSNKKIATVTSAGKIKGVKKGTATITVKSGTVTKKVKVTVK